MDPRQTTPVPWLETLVLGLGVAVLVGMLSQGLQSLAAHQSSLGTLVAFNAGTPESAAAGRQPVAVKLVGDPAGATCTLDVGTMRASEGSLIVTAEEPNHAVQALWRGGRTAASGGCPSGATVRLEAWALSDLKAAARGLASDAELLMPAMGGW